MQKGKGDSGGLVRAAVITMLFLALSPGRCGAADSWARGMGGVVFPGRDHPAAYDRPGGYLLALVSAANPFSIPGLYRSTASISLVRGRFAVRTLWERTGTDGYSSDLLEASGGLALPGGIVGLAAAVRADSRSVAGFGRETAISIACSLSLEFSNAVVLEIESCAGRPGGSQDHAAVRVGRRDAFLMLTLGRNGRGGRTARAGGSVALARRLSFLAGYDIVTGEVSGGLAVRGSALAAFSWSSHPVLGSTFSVSAGAVR